MTYLIVQIVACLLAAALLGLGIGYWLFGRRYKAMFLAKEVELGKQVSLAAQLESRVMTERDALRASIADLEHEVAVTADPSLQSDYPVEAIQGIGKSFGARLRDLGIGTTGQFVEELHAEEARRSVADQLDIEEGWVFRMHCMADLMRVPGIDGHDAELLEAAGVSTVPELAGADPVALAALLTEIKEQHHLAQDTPSAQQLEEWAANAQDLVAEA